MVNLISGEKWGGKGQGVVGTVMSNFGWLKEKQNCCLCIMLCAVYSYDAWVKLWKTSQGKFQY